MAGITYLVGSTWYLSETIQDLLILLFFSQVKFIHFPFKVNIYNCPLLQCCSDKERTNTGSRQKFYITAAGYEFE